MFAILRFFCAKMCTLSICVWFVAIWYVNISYAPHTYLQHILQYPEKKIGHIKSFFELEADDIDKKTIKFDKFKGKVTVITNVASYCGK